MFKIRDYHASDEDALAELYEHTVRQWAPDLYSPEQVEAWATVPRDHNRFNAMLTDGRTFVATNASNFPVGFSGVEKNGRISSLYVAANSTRQGIGSALLRHVIDYANTQGISSLWTEASFLSRPVFEKHGFVIHEEEHLLFNGVEFKRWIMKLPAGCYPSITC